jgi:hypothetical protein
MSPAPELQIEPSPQVLTVAREWLARVRPALGADFLAAYVTGSALTQGFDPRRSDLNLLVVTRGLGPETLDRLVEVMPKPARRPHVEPLFLTRTQIEKSLDAFPIEFLDIQEGHLLLEGENVFAGITVPRTHLRLQCEHELRGKFIHLRQTYLRERRSRALYDTLAGTASSFAALFRTLLRLRGEEIPAHTARVIEKVADVYGLEAEGLLVAYTMRYGSQRLHAAAIRNRYLQFMIQIDRLVAALDRLQI